MVVLDKTTAEHIATRRLVRSDLIEVMSMIPRLLHRINDHDEENSNSLDPVPFWECAERMRSAASFIRIAIDTGSIAWDKTPPAAAGEDLVAEAATFVDAPGGEG